MLGLIAIKLMVRERPPEQLPPIPSPTCTALLFTRALQPGRSTTVATSGIRSCFLWNR